jgi:uncharacterized phage protein (TIGR01671 family)
MLDHRFRFRVWDREAKKYYHTTLDGMQAMDPIKVISRINDPLNIDYSDIGPFVTEQCTGLKDRNGQLIYERDVVNIYIRGDLEGIGLMFWDEQAAQFMHTWAEMEDGKYNGFHRPPKCLWRNNDCAIEVIGNIHENPELLEV